VAGVRRRKVCRFCVEKEIIIDYKRRHPEALISERGKGRAAAHLRQLRQHQRVLATQIQRARALALIPYAISGA